jgi:hypothetical protein
MGLGTGAGCLSYLDDFVFGMLGTTAGNGKAAAALQGKGVYQGINR